MISNNVDLGQLIIGALITIVGWFSINTINDFKKQLEKHQTILMDLVRDVQLIKGYYGIDRRERKD